MCGESRTHGAKRRITYRYLMIGAAGVGKTTFFLCPNLEYACACGVSFLALDTKGDLAARAKAEKYARILAKTIISPDGDSGSYGQNAFFTILQRGSSPP